MATDSNTIEAVVIMDELYGVVEEQIIAGTVVGDIIATAVLEDEMKIYV